MTRIEIYVESDNPALIEKVRAGLIDWQDRLGLDVDANGTFYDCTIHGDCADLPPDEVVWHSVFDGAENNAGNLDDDGDPHHRYSMYTPAGNAACAEHVAPLLQAIRNEEFKRSSLPGQYEAVLREIALTHGEVYDTEPRGQIVDEIDKACAAVGWAPLSGSY